MKKIKVMTVFGTRPEAIKMAPLVKELKKYEEIDSKVCVTAQHRQMLDQVLEIFNIKPDYDLDIMQDRQTLSDITTRALTGLHGVFKEAEPDIVLVHGDTTTTFAASLAAFYTQVKVGHVEAGLRTYDKYSPYPEEMNRKLTGSIADLHFSPTFANKENLLKENISEQVIYVTGNTVIDALSDTVSKDYVFTDSFLKGFSFDNKRVLLVTAHRRENIGEPLENICTALRRLCDETPDLSIIYPVHLNPVVRETAARILGNHERIHLIEPLNVQDMHNLMDRCTLVMTDSGGLQEEAPSLGKPVLVLRNETERPEAIKAGTVRLLGTDTDKIYAEARLLLDDENEYRKMTRAVNPYGDGKASERIVKALLYHFGLLDIRPEEFLPGSM
ncbi:MAG: UDP-N-acetylglucosamine 2-epimerase (non-hydrolyzing) [Clostridiaceae bacterium]|jgi:UDP-N-acetylglucosamine 2-epimerase|nr:UDP-N-acetylglucosamine 2-epimerase (non-hydrolyzing) [Clostridiaceae bacterium]